MSKYLLAATVLSLSACGSKSADTNPADTAAVTSSMTVTDTTIKTDTVKVAGDTAKMY